MEGPKILTVDIENSPVRGYVWSLWKQNVGLNQIERDWYMLTWAAKWMHEDEVQGDSLIHYKDEFKAHPQSDYYILLSLRDLLDEADIVVGWNSKAFDIPKINARNTKIPLETVRIIPEEVAKRCEVLPIDQIGKILVVVTPNVDSPETVAEVRRVTGSLVTPIQCAREGFAEIVNDYYRRLSLSGLQPAAVAASPGAAVAASAPQNGTEPHYTATPVGSDLEDAWWKRYCSAGPVPAEARAL